MPEYAQHFLSVSDNSAFSGLLFPPCSRRVICSLFLIFDLFGQIIEVDPTVHLLLQIGFQLLLFWESSWSLT